MLISRKGTLNERVIHICFLYFYLIVYGEYSLDTSLRLVIPVMHFCYFWLTLLQVLSLFIYLFFGLRPTSTSVITFFCNIYSGILYYLATGGFLKTFENLQFSSDIFTISFVLMLIGCFVQRAIVPISMLNTLNKKL